MTDHPTINALAEQIGFHLPERYNAARLLWDNLAEHGERPAVMTDSGTWTYRQLASEAARIGNVLLASGCRPGDRMLLFLDDEPAYPAASDLALAEALKRYAKQRLLPHKYPREIVFLDALPKTGTGKIDRQALRQPAPRPTTAREDD